MWDSASRMQHARHRHRQAQKRYRDDMPKIRKATGAATVKRIITGSDPRLCVAPRAWRVCAWRLPRASDDAPLRTGAD